MQIKPYFDETFERLIQKEKGTTDRKLDITRLQQAALLNKEILKGKYKNIAGDERLQITEDKYVKINFASSGQQESVWILNVLFYYMINGMSTCFIIEESESHLYPDSLAQVVNPCSWIDFKMMAAFHVSNGQFGIARILTMKTFKMM